MADTRTSRRGKSFFSVIVKYGEFCSAKNLQNLQTKKLYILYGNPNSIE